MTKSIALPLATNTKDALAAFRDKPRLKVGEDVSPQLAGSLVARGIATWVDYRGIWMAPPSHARRPKWGFGMQRHIERRMP